MQKRASTEDDEEVSTDPKRRKVEEQSLVALSTDSSKGARLTSLPFSDVQLTGHEGAVLGLSFDSTGRYICSSAFDRQICKLVFF